MSLFTDIVTVYNHYIDPDGVDRWKRTVIKGVQWTHNRVELKLGGNIQSNDRVESLTIDFCRDYGNDPYILPKEFDGVTGWTLNTEDGQDIIVLGEVTTEIDENFNISDLLQTYQYVGIVTSVTDNRNRRFLRTIKATLK